MVASSKPVNNALNPAWRETAVHMIVKTSWTSNLTQARVDVLQNDATNRTGAAMRQFTPDSGCYVNEVCFFSSCKTSLSSANLRTSATS
jgi:hypothetical protein